MTRRMTNPIGDEGVAVRPRRIGAVLAAVALLSGGGLQTETAAASTARLPVKSWPSEVVSADSRVQTTPDGSRVLAWSRDDICGSARTQAFDTAGSPIPNTDFYPAIPGIVRVVSLVPGDGGVWFARTPPASDPLCDNDGVVLTDEQRSDIDSYVVEHVDWTGTHTRFRQPATAGTNAVAAVGQDEAWAVNSGAGQVVRISRSGPQTVVATSPDLRGKFASIAPRAEGGAYVLSTDSPLGGPLLQINADGRYSGSGSSPN